MQLCEEFTDFSPVPLVLSMGITHALQVNLIQEVEVLKSKGDSLTETGSKKVCGDRKCVEIEENSENLKVCVSEMIMNQESTISMSKVEITYCIISSRKIIS